MQKKARAPRMATPTTEPITIPAIAPPDKPCLESPVAEGKGVRGGRVAVGIGTPSQRLVALDFVQQLSVPFAQKVQRPIVFVPKPQLPGSFAAPLTQSPERASDGFSQIVNSA